MKYITLNIQFSAKCSGPKFDLECVVAGWMSECGRIPTVCRPLAAGFLTLRPLEPVRWRFLHKTRFLTGKEVRQPKVTICIDSVLIYGQTGET